MTEIIWPSDTPEVTDAIRAAIGRAVEFYTISASEPCPLCNLDPITNTSTDSFCPSCSGEYWIRTYSATTVSGHITWGHLDQMGWETGGQIFEGDARLQIKYTVANLELVEDVKWLVVDGKKMSIVKVIYRGVPNINRILLDLQEEDKQGD
jgi:hypothetical protein